MEVTTDVKFPETSRRLLEQLAKKEITLAEFLRECGYWALQDGFDELRPFRLPTKPDIVTTFEEKPIATIQGYERKFYDDNPSIMSYYRKLNWVLARNRYALGWLKEIKTYLPQEDLPNQKKLDDCIQMFFHWKAAVTPSLLKYNELRAENIITQEEKQPEKDEESYWAE